MSPPIRQELIHGWYRELCTPVVLVVGITLRLGKPSTCVVTRLGESLRHRPPMNRFCRKLNPTTSEAGRLHRSADMLYATCRSEGETVLSYELQCVSDLHSKQNMLLPATSLSAGGWQRCPEAFGPGVIGVCIYSPSTAATRIKCHRSGVDPVLEAGRSRVFGSP